MSDDRSLLDKQLNQFENEELSVGKTSETGEANGNTDMNGQSSKSETKATKSKEMQSKPGKGAKLAVVVAIGIVALFGNKMLSTSEEANSQPSQQSSKQEASSEATQPVVPEPEQIASGTVLDPAIEEFIDNSDPEPTAVAPEAQPVSPDGQFNSGFFSGIEPEVGTFNQIGFEQDFIDEDYLTSQLQMYVDESTFNAAQQDAIFKIEQQAELIDSLRQSVVALNSRLTELNEVVSSVELEVLLQKERPELSDLAIIVPDPTCDICSAKARFVWQQEPVIVANGSEWMGYNVRIESDYLSLVNGSVVHDFATNL